jgi:hypothetical protein
MISQTEELFRCAVDSLTSGGHPPGRFNFTVYFGVYRWVEVDRAINA